MKGELEFHVTREGTQVIREWADAYTEYGVNMGEGFISALLTPAAPKSLVESDCRLEDGKVVLTDTENHIDSRDVTLPFTVMGMTTAEYDANQRKFLELLYTGTLTLRVPPLGDEVYRLVYQKSSSYAQNTARTICKVSVKFTEPDPTDRDEEAKTRDYDA
ncbi:MAG: hypothetical protein LUC33_00305 [Prevotellaceae bacterium]|nr:hypothetical protein [Prevotellaceae bacterium]